MPQLPALVDAAGQPLRRALLTQEIAHASAVANRSIITGHPADGLTPRRLAQLLRAAEAGDAVAYLELAEAMEERDLHYLAVLGTRKRQVSQLPISVVAASSSPADEAIADMVREWVDRDTIESDLFDILDATGKGFSLTEIVWDTAGRRWFPASLKYRDPRWFEFDRVDGRTPLLRGEGPPQPLPKFKFIYHEHPAKSGLPIRGGLARPVAWAYLFKNYAIKDWVAFAEIYGMPFRIGKYAPGVTDADIRTLMRAVQGMGQDAAAVIPDSMIIELVDGKSTGSADLYERMCAYLDKQISKAVLGQTATTDSEGGGLGGSGKEHNDVRGDIERADAKLVAASLNRDLVRPMIELNFGPQPRYPRIVIGREETVDLERLGNFLSVVVPLGMRVSEEQVRNFAGLAAPAGDEPVLAAPVPAPAPAPAVAPGAQGGAGRPLLPAPAPAAPEIAASGFLDLLKASYGEVGTVAARAGSASAAAPDLIDGFVVRELGDWQALLDPALAPVDALLAGAASLDDVRDRLAAAAAGMGTEALTELLAQGLFAARLTALAGAAIETG